MKSAKKSKRLTAKERVKKLRQEAWDYFSFCNLIPTEDDIDNFIESNGIIDLVPSLKKGKRNVRK